MKNNTTFKQTEIGMIPSDWEVVKLGNVSEIRTGPFGSSLHEKDYVTDGTPIITVEHLGEFGIVHKNMPMVSDKDKKRLISYSMQPNDIVFSRVGSVDRNSMVTESEQGWLFSGRLLRIRIVAKNVSPKYLSFYFQQETFKQRIRSVAVGQTMASLNTQILKGVDVVLPPTLAEQKAIATALNDADALIQTLEQLIAKKRNIKTGAMQELLKPKKGWEVKKLGDLTKVFTKQTGFDYTAYIKPSLVNNKTDDTIPFIQNKDFNNKWINFNTDYYIPKSVAFNFPRILLNEKSLLISISGSVGNVGVYDSKELAFIGGAVAILKFKNPNLIDWVWIYLKSERGQEKLFGNTKSSSHVNLILDDIRKFEIEFPKEEEQSRIARILSDMDNEIDELEKQLEKYKMIKQGMMQNLLTGKIRLI
jgi:type I restriction enzyme S subunit